jgi:pyruvate dehydrogenase E1 component alpha subunit
MVLIRATEEKLGDMVAAGHIRCPTHLAIGQEAPAAALAPLLRRHDRVFGMHRSHAFYLALGGDLRGLMAEVQGKVTGVSRGMGGSMHLLAREHGLYGTVPILGTTIPITVGAAWAAKMDRQGGVAVASFGDGATEEGVFHESMNLAANFKLPVLFLCENNFFSSHLHISLRQPSDTIARYAEAHRIPWDLVDGNDVVALHRTLGAALQHMRTEGGPHFVEAVTYRWRGHVGPKEDEDVGVRRKEDLGRWKRRDPIRRLADALRAAGALRQADLEEMWSGARVRVDAAWEQASRDPYPPTEQLLDCVLSRPE